MSKKEFLKEDIQEFQTCFYNYLSEEAQNILDHLKQDLQKEIERVANELEYLAEEIRDYNKCINELLFNEKEDKE